MINLAFSANLAARRHNAAPAMRIMQGVAHGLREAQHVANRQQPAASSGALLQPRHISPFLFPVCNHSFAARDGDLTQFGNVGV